MRSDIKVIESQFDKELFFKCPKCKKSLDVGGWNSKVVCPGCNSIITIVFPKPYAEIK